MEALKNWDGLKECKILYAYETALKPTVMATPRLALSLRGAEGKLLTVGGAEKQLTYEIGLDLYLPVGMAGLAQGVLDEAAECLFCSDELAVIGCRAEKTQWDSKAESLRLPCSFWLEEVF